jgi:hypothetical protein
MTLAISLIETKGLSDDCPAVMAVAISAATAALGSGRRSPGFTLDSQLGADKVHRRFAAEIGCRPRAAGAAAVAAVIKYEMLMRLSQQLILSTRSAMLLALP